MAINVVQDYIEELECAISQCDQRDSVYLTQLNYSEMAASDILELLKKNTTVPPIWIIEEYKNHMDKYMYMNSAGSYMFSVFHDAAEYIIDSLC